MPNNLARVFENSSSVVAGEFNPETNQITIVFKGGATYKYDDCSLEEWEQIATAHSVGKAVHSVLKATKKHYERMK